MGILRIDIALKYEKKAYHRELLYVCIENFYTLFNVSRIATKAVDQAVTRIEVLNEVGFRAEDFKGRDYYYLRSR